MSLKSNALNASCSGFGIRHAFAVCASEPRGAVEGFDHVHGPVARCDLHAYSSVVLARIPPIVPYAGLDDGRLALAENARVLEALHACRCATGGMRFD